MNSIYNYFKQINDKEKLSHAFLIGNIYFENYKEELQKVIEEFIIRQKVDIENNPDIYILKPEEKSITKEQIKDLIQKLSTTSQHNGKKIYIITECEKLSDIVYNALLKTIEEPGEGVFAILITSNFEKVSDTIKSRCTKIHINEENANVSHSYITDKFITAIETNKINAIYLNNDLYNEIEDRNILKQTINEMLEIYKKALYTIIEGEKPLDNQIKFLTVSNNINTITKKIIIINKFIEKSNYYLNKNLLIDKIIIELGRCSDETSIS